MGPHQRRLTDAVSSAARDRVSGAADDWDRTAGRLDSAAANLRSAARASTSVGGEAGSAMEERFNDAVQLLLRRSRQMAAGAAALTQSMETIDRATTAHRNIATSDIVAEPYRQPPGFADMTERDKQVARDTHDRTQAGAMADEEAKREEQARVVAENFDRDYETPIETMKKIYGYQEPPAGTSSTSGGGGGPSSVGYSGRSAGGTGTSGPGLLNGAAQPDGSLDHVDSPPTGEPDTSTNPNLPDPSNDPTTEPTTEPSTPPDATTPSGSGQPLPPVSTGGPGGGVSPGVLGGVAGGIVGGAALGAIARNGGLSGLLGKGSLSSRGVAPIGGSSKGSSGVLGRSGAGTGAAGRGAGTAGRGADAAGRGAGAAGRGGGASGRGAGGRAAGSGRGGGAGAGGRGGKSKDQRKSADQEHFDDGEDWLDDEGAGPAVLG